MVTTTNYRALVGGQVNVVSVLSGADRGFTKAGSAITGNGAACGSAVQFGVLAGTATPGVTSGDMIYDIQLNTTGSTPASKCWQVNLTYTSSSGMLTTKGPVWIGTGIVVPPLNQAIDCKFDLGTSLPPSPFSYSLAVTT